MLIDLSVRGDMYCCKDRQIPLLFNRRVLEPAWQGIREGMRMIQNALSHNPAAIAGLPPRYISQEVIVNTPPSDPDDLIQTLNPNDVVVVEDSEDARFDALKRRLFEYGHIGRDPLSRKQKWRGALSQRPSCPPIPPGKPLPTVISYFTVDTGYADLAERLKASCKNIGLSWVIEGIHSRGSWESNCAFKPHFILEKWRELQVPVLWLDVDAVVHRLPSLLAAEESDFAVHKVDRWEIASGTVFFNQTSVAHALLENWVARCEASPEIWDQQNLDAAWEEISYAMQLRTSWLPQSYTRIFDRDALPGEDPRPVIEHFQASRELKMTISDIAPSPFRNFYPEFIAARSVSRPFLRFNDNRSFSS